VKNIEIRAVFIVEGIVVGMTLHVKGLIVFVSCRQSFNKHWRIFSLLKTFNEVRPSFCIEILKKRKILRSFLNKRESVWLDKSGEEEIL